MTATSAFRFREKTLKLSATVLSTLTLYLSNNTRMLSCNCIAIVDLQVTLRRGQVHSSLITHQLTESHNKLDKRKTK